MANWVDWIGGRTFPESLRQELDAKISAKRLAFSTESDTTVPSKDDIGGKEDVLKFLPMVLANGQNLRLPEGHEASSLHFCCSNDFLVVFIIVLKVFLARYSVRDFRPFS